MKGDSKFDTHQHVLMRKHQIPQSILKAGLFDLTGPTESEFMEQPFFKWKRPISSPIFFPENLIEYNRKNGIKGACLLTLSQLYCNGIDRQRTYEIISWQNDFQLELQETYQNEFFCGFVIQPRWIEDALNEIEKRYKQGFKFICLPTHYQREDGKLVTCTDKNCQEIFALANKYDLAIQFHPYNYEIGMGNIADFDFLGAAHVVFMAPLTHHLHFIFTCLGLHVKFPNVRFTFSHGNLGADYGRGRKIQWFYGRPDLFPGVEESWIKIVIGGNIFCDNITHSVSCIRSICENSGTTNLIDGSDTPYPLGEVDYVKGLQGQYRGYFTDLAVIKGILNPNQKIAIEQDNGLAWLFGRDTKEFKEKKQLLFG